MKIGIEKLKIVVVFFAGLGSAIDKSTQNGLDAEDLGNIITPLIQAPDAFAAMKEAGVELKDLDDNEMAEIKTVIANSLTLVDKDVEVIAERILATVIDIYSLVTAIKAARA